MIDQRCEISIQTRRNCSSCRLAKCLAVGMSPELIRKEEQKPMKNSLKTTKKNRFDEKNEKNSFVVQLTPTDWTFLSELIRNFDQITLTENLRRSINDLTSSNLIEIPFDMGNALEMISSRFSSMFLFIQHSPHFRFIERDLQWILIERYFIFIVDLSSLQIYRDFSLFQNEKFVESFTNIFGSTMFNFFKRISDKLEFDSNLLKIFYLILFFSTELPMGNFYPMNSNENFNFNRQNLFLIQNHYVELFWKYSIHRYGFLNSTRKFLCLLDLIHQLNKYSTWNYTNNTIYHDLVDQSLENIKNSLSFK